MAQLGPLSVDFNSVVDRLQIALAEPLPGAPAQALMAPRPRREWPISFDPARIRHAGGLLLVFPIDASAHIVLTVRADTLGRHGGKVSLPGGVVEAGETFAEAAVREAHEEVGLSPHDVRVLGALTPLDIPVSGFRLHPSPSHTPRPIRLRQTGKAEMVQRLSSLDIEREFRSGGH